MNTVHSLIRPGLINKWYNTDGPYPAHLLVPWTNKHGAEFACNITYGYPDNDTGYNQDKLNRSRFRLVNDPSYKCQRCLSYDPNKTYTAGDDEVPEEWNEDDDPEDD